VAGPCRAPGRLIERELVGSTGWNWSPAGTGTTGSFARPALINSGWDRHGSEGRPLPVMAMTVVQDKIVALDIVVDPDRLEQLDLTVLDRGYEWCDRLFCDGADPAVGMDSGSSGPASTCG
jgi:hypothetical protein